MLVDSTSWRDWINQPFLLHTHPFDRVSLPFLPFFIFSSSSPYSPGWSSDNYITWYLIQGSNMARRSGRFKAVDGDVDDMEVEGMLIDDDFSFLHSHRSTTGQADDSGQVNDKGDKGQKGESAYKIFEESSWRSEIDDDDMDDGKLGEGSGTTGAEGSKRGISATSVFIDEKLIM
jgi:hypothetical protein